MFSIAALNDTDSGGQWEPLAPTKEAQEFHLSQNYHEGLLKLEAKDYEKARQLFESVLSDPLLSSANIGSLASDGHLLQLRFLALKNLAIVFLQRGPAHYDMALNCYLQAVDIDTKDPVIWNQLGTLSCSMGLLSTSRWAFEQGLSCSPNNWNCMEKLMEVLIAIGDEVACLSVANSVLRHWPSHPRALHVKRTIEDDERIPLAPRGIDKLEPKHSRLCFSRKRKERDDDVDEGSLPKVSNQSVDLCLDELTWDALGNEVLRTLSKMCGKVFQEQYDQVLEGLSSGKVMIALQKIMQTDRANAGTRQFEKGYQPHDVKVIIRPPFQESTEGRAGLTDSDSAVDKKSTLNDDHHQGRRSTRLESLRSHKPSKEESNSTTNKESAKNFYQSLEPFILGSKESKNGNFEENLLGPCSNILDCLSDQEHDDVMKFISSVSNNYGACHLGHMLLEEISLKGITFKETFARYLMLEKLTRQWPQQRTLLCSLFLAELYYDFGLSAGNESRSFFSESSYHLCKVIELLASCYDNLSSHAANNIWDSPISDELENTHVDFGTSGCNDVATLTFNGRNSASDSVNTSNLKDSKFHAVFPDDGSSVQVRFYWLSASLSFVDGCTDKAITCFSACLSSLEKMNMLNGSDSCILLPHCKNIKWLNMDRVRYEINLLKVGTFPKRSVSELMEKGMYSKCIDLLAPLLHSVENVYPYSVYSAFTENDITLNEVEALDILLDASKRAEPMQIEVHLNSHKRKLQIVAAAAGASELSLAQRLNEKTEQKFDLVCDVDNVGSSPKDSIHMLSEEVKEISSCASLVKSYFDQHDSSVLGSLQSILSDIQSVLLTILCFFTKIISAARYSFSANQTEDIEIQCLVDAAIAFCKLQHLDPSVSVKDQVDLISAIHELLAEYGLCCAGIDGEGKEGTFLKLAIKHLLALGVKLKPSSHSYDSVPPTKQTDGSISLDGNEKLGEGKSGLVLEMQGNESNDRSDVLLGIESPSQCLPICIPQASNVDLESVNNTDVSILHAESNGKDGFPDLIPVSDDNENKEVELGIDYALDQSFFCLYGLDLNSRQDSCCEDDLAVHENTNRGDYQTKEQCADVFQYILPYAKVSSRTGLVKLRRVLRAIRKHFPQPPDDILAENFIKRFLDSSDRCEDELFEIARLNDNQKIMNALFGDEDNQIQKKISESSTQQYSEVYSNLYFYIAQAEEISATDKLPGFVLNKEGEDFVEQSANLFIYDLLYNPLRFESWQKLANIYDEEVDLLLNDGSKHMSIADWGKNSTFLQRVERGRRRSRRCFLMSLALARTPTERSEIHELLGLVYYDSLQNVVPFYDQRTAVPKRDATWMICGQSSVKNFEMAFSLNPDWIHAFYLGKLFEKVTQNPVKALSYYNKAIMLNPTAVDAFYRMHASRLKLLSRFDKKNMDMIKIVSLYSFNQSTKKRVFEIFDLTTDDLNQPPKDLADCNTAEAAVKEEKSIEPHLVNEAWQLLYKDCLSALETCTEGELKHYHKARYMLAQGFYMKGDLEKSRDELSFCFRSSRSSFTINMWEIDSTVKKGRRKTTPMNMHRRVLEVCLPESSRKFITCIRKYILFYLDVLENLKDLCTLERAYQYLKTDKKFALCLGDIIPLALGRYIRVLSMLISNAEVTGAPDASDSLKHYLEKMFYILMDHVNFWADISNLSELKCPEMSETNLCRFIHQYICTLECDTRIYALEGINEKIRKRFKNPKLASPNSAKICKHASLSWCRSILVKLASITPIADHGHLGTCATDGFENCLLLFVDIQFNEVSKISFESEPHSMYLEMKWSESLSKIKNLHIRQAIEENMESAVNMLKHAYNFYRDCSCGTFPSGINLYAVSSSQSDKEAWHGIDLVDLSVPRKLLLWAYTLVHGHYSNISNVVKYCEENSKPKLKRGVTLSSTSSHPNAPVTVPVPQQGIGKERSLPEERVASEENPDTCNMMEHISNKLLVPSQFAPTVNSELHQCASTKALDST